MGRLDNGVVFDPLFAFPFRVFLESLVWFEDGTAGDVPPATWRSLEAAVRALDLAAIPHIQPLRTSIGP